MEEAEKLRKSGYCVLPNLFDPAEIHDMRESVLANTHRMAKTRSQKQSLHLAGFHRYPSLSNLHAKISSNEVINKIINEFYGAENYYTIGLSDITINRSQHWHTDLLRGKYSTFLDNVDPWRSENDTCIKALVYLQPGRSLRIIEESNRQKMPLNDDDLKRSTQLENAKQLELNAGDVILMDIRAVHRGSTDEEINSLPENAQKILISTVFGKINSQFALAMQSGNLSRNTDWDQQWLK